MKRIIVVILILLSSASFVEATSFNKTNADVSYSMCNKSKWLYIYETDDAEYYEDIANSRLILSGEYPEYIAYILTVYKKPTAILASLNQMLYIYDKQTKEFYASDIDFRTYNTSGIIFTPKALNKVVPTNVHQLDGYEKIVAEKVFPLGGK